VVYAARAVVWRHWTKNRHSSEASKYTATRGEPSRSAGRNDDRILNMKRPKAKLVVRGLDTDDGAILDCVVGVGGEYWLFI
jgi:hypothetical protein